MIIRPTIPSDAAEIARLTTELGYAADSAACSVAPSSSPRRTF